MHYIETLREDERVNEIYLCKNKQSALTKAGKPYEALIYRIKQAHWMQNLGAGLCGN